MSKLWIFAIAVFVLVALAVIVPFPCLRAGEARPAGHYQVLAPIRNGNLTIFPVVAESSHDTSQFLTLDEGLRSGDVVVTESGSAGPLVRPRPGHPVQNEHPQTGGAQVNQLVLINNSKRPLLLLAGEIVTGGKQDRIIGKDRIVPAESDPVDLSVFCVEPERWVARSDKFGAPMVMVQPSVRGKAMADKDQHQVWDQVAKARNGMAETVTAEAGALAAAPIQESSSYAVAVDNKAVKRQLESVTVPVEQEYQSAIRQLRDKHAVGVVVAVNGQVIWVDVFASSSLLEKYWPKLVRSYAAESFSQQGKSAAVDVRAAQDFLDHLDGRREIVEREPGLYRHSEITGDGYKVFALTSLLPSTGFDLHVAKMAE
jgi:ARG and Rhodanese-Phosphatase-superfamily-associated Protein domain